MANRLLFLACFALYVALSYAVTNVPTLTNCAGSTSPSISSRAEYVCVNLTAVSGFTSYGFTLNSVVVNKTYSVVNGTKIFIGPLKVNTSYSITAHVVTNGVPSANESTALVISTATTSGLGPIRNPSEDLATVTCVGGVNTQTKRSQITCSWTLGSIVPRKVIVSALCKGGNATGSITGRKIHNHHVDPIKVVNATTTTFAVNRHPATCTIMVRARYAIVSPRTKAGNARIKGGAQKFNIVKGSPFIRSVTV